MIENLQRNSVVLLLQRNKMACGELVLLLFFSLLQFSLFRIRFFTYTKCCYFYYFSCYIIAVGVTDSKTAKKYDSMKIFHSFRLIIIDKYQRFYIFISFGFRSLNAKHLPQLNRLRTKKEKLYQMPYDKLLHYK